MPTTIGERHQKAGSNERLGAILSVLLFVAVVCAAVAPVAAAYYYSHHYVAVR
jgi:hypothetical protein